MKVLRFRHINLIGLERQHHRGFHLAGMNAKTVFMRAEPVRHRRSVFVLERQIE